MNFSAVEALRAAHPLVHCVSNIVSANPCANILLAAGGAPIMAQAPQEVEDITAHAAATVLNMGTPSAEKFALCRSFGCAATVLGRPVVLDPVGVGASEWRLRQNRLLLEAFTPAVVRVNLGEAQALLGRPEAACGVDSAEGGAAQARRAALTLARQLGCVVLLSGSVDYVTDGRQLYRVEGGSPLMAAVTGTGCMLSALCGAFCAVLPREPLQAATLAAAFWKACAAVAATQATAPGSFAAALPDAAWRLTGEQVAEMVPVTREEVEMK